ncbi:MAG: cytidylate kinase-like family protein [Proteobacteria bacterium]|nr:cytidylate kinase-like family protein [Pseudomonadota bacterium]
MAIITISRGCFSHGQQIAEKVAGVLGYRCISREVLVDAAQLFNVSERKLIKSIHDAPNILERITQGREKYLVYIQAAILEQVKQDNVVYHGHAGHLLLAEIPRVLKVRVIADLEDRVMLLQQKQNLSKEEALSLIKEEDNHRVQWTRYLYKMDLNDPQLYDIVIRIGGLTIEDACEIICTAARSDTYKPTSESSKAINDLAISRYLRAALTPICEAKITVKDGNVRINVAAQKIRKTGQTSPALQLHIFNTIKEDLTRQILEIAKKVPGINDVVCDIDLPYYS